MSLFDWVGGLFGGLSDAVGMVWDWITAPFQAVWDWIVNLFDWGSIFSGVASYLSSWLPWNWGSDDEESSSDADDLAMGPGPGKVITSPAGTYNLNPMDTVVAGTELGGGGGGAAPAEGGAAGMSAVIAKLDKLIQVASQGGQVTLDGKQVGEVLQKGITPPVRG